MSKFIVALCFFSSWPTSYATVVPTATTTDLRRYYTHSHSLGSDSYNFSSRDGWHSVNASDLEYKYSNNNAIQKRDKHTTNAKSMLDAATNSITSGDIGAGISHVLGAIWNALKGIGEHEVVKITWYTGHDLLNPSCWPNTKWAPTDKSFTCALTLKGWKDRPKCFDFLEICNGPKKCIFVRVIDSCAGCAEGSKHVDLTKAAFAQLEDLDTGVLNVQMRAATQPKEWFEDMWGPRH